MVLEDCGDGNAHWLDDGSEHPHRIALSMVSECVPHAEQRLQQLCRAEGLKVSLLAEGLLRSVVAPGHVVASLP